MFKKKEEERSMFGKKIVGFLFSFLGLSLFVLIWFILGFFPKTNVIPIKDVIVNTFNLLKDNFALKFWESDFYLGILTTILSINIVFIICLLLSIAINLLNKNYYFKSFFKSFKIISFIILPLLTYIIYNLISFKGKSFFNSALLNPILIGIIINLGIFLDQENSLVNTFQKAINSISKVVVAVEIIGAKWFNADQVNFGKLINNKMLLKENKDLISLFLIFIIIVLLVNIPFIITKLLFTKNKKKKAK